MEFRFIARRYHGASLAALLLFNLLPGLTRAAESLSLEFASQNPGGARVYASDAATPWGTLQVLSGATVTLQVESGRHYEVRATGWRWSQAQEVPANVDAVQVTPRIEGETVTLDVMVYQQDNDRRYSYSTSVGGDLGEWIQVLGPAARPGVKVFGAGVGAGDGRARPLYIRVSATGGG